MRRSWCQAKTGSASSTLVLLACASYSQTESDGTSEVSRRVSVRVVPGGKVGGDTSLDEREEEQKPENDCNSGVLSRSV